MHYKRCCIVQMSLLYYVIFITAVYCIVRTHFSSKSTCTADETIQICNSESAEGYCM